MPFAGNMVHGFASAILYLFFCICVLLWCCIPRLYHWFLSWRAHVVGGTREEHRRTQRGDWLV